MIAHIGVSVSENFRRRRGKMPWVRGWENFSLIWLWPLLVDFDTFSIAFGSGHAQDLP
jgi:hypothetical protein